MAAVVCTKCKKRPIGDSRFKNCERCREARRVYNSRYGQSKKGRRTRETREARVGVREAIQARDRARYTRRKADPEWAEAERQRKADYKQSDQNRDAVLRRLYGVTLFEYEEMAERQHGVCAICSRPDPKGRNLAVDHCHKTGRVRGLLCSPCNNGLGRFRDNTELLRKAIDYLG